MDTIASVWDDQIGDVFQLYADKTKNKYTLTSVGFNGYECLFHVIQHGTNQTGKFKGSRFYNYVNITKKEN